MDRIEIPEGKVFVKLTSGQGIFVDVTQQNGKVCNHEIVLLERTARVEHFISNKGIREVDPNSKEYSDYLDSIPAREEAAKALALKDRAVRGARNNVLATSIADAMFSVGKRMQADEAESSGWNARATAEVAVNAFSEPNTGDDNSGPGNTEETGVDNSQGTDPNANSDPGANNQADPAQTGKDKGKAK